MLMFRRAAPQIRWCISLHRQNDGRAGASRTTKCSPGGIILTGPNVFLCRRLLKPPRTQDSSRHASSVARGL